MKKFILLTEKAWHNLLFERLQKRDNEAWCRIASKDDFNLSFLNEFQPDQIFIPHWSHIIPESIWSVYTCVVFHMTDLPYGRGGSPLQNLIVRGHKETRISALKVEKGIDTGAIYLKADLSLEGSAEAIFNRSEPIIEELIVTIIDKDIQPVPQKGTPVVFKRRTPDQSNVGALEKLDALYNYIRMLDADGYPKAFMENESFRFEFQNAEVTSDKELTAHVRIIKK